MKKQLLILSLLLLIRVVSHAQTWVYHPMPYSNAIWKYSDDDWDPMGNGCTMHYQYRINGDDTLVGSKLYYKVYDDTYLLNCPSPPSPFQHVGLGYYGAIRNDTLNKKVYWLPPSNLIESLLYDFNLNIGDTSIDCHGIVTSIDSILIGGNYRKRFITIDTNSTINYIIEGIGNVGHDGTGFGADLFTPICYETYLSPPYTHFICFSNGVNEYVLSPIWCQPFLGIINPEEMTSVTISPNPFETSTLISLNLKKKISNASIVLYDFLGKKVKEINNINENEIILNRENLKSGIYFYKLTSNDQVSSGKIIVQ